MEGVAFRQPDLREIVNSTDLLVRSIDDDFDALLERVKNEADAPSVDLLGIRREVAIADTLVSTGSAAIHAVASPFVVYEPVDVVSAVAVEREP